MKGVFSNHIKVTWDFIGFHNYPNAPLEVGFLSNMHRHKFKCSAKIQVRHAERELEFFIVQQQLKDLTQNGEMNSKSCETIAQEIVFFICEKYPDRDIEVEVSEDGENSAIVGFKCA